MIQERTNLILEEIDKRGFVKVSELSELLQCSEVTIRNDIKALEQKGLLQRIHGGAVRSGLQFQQKHPGESIYRNVDRKTLIAKRAYEFIEDNDTIIIDDSSTTLYLTSLIKDDPSKHLTVVTNSLTVATELADIPHVNLFMVGGQIGGALPAAMGEMTVNNLSEFYIDKAFIGVRGVNFKVGITSIAFPQMQVKRAIIKVSKKVYVMADSSKFGGAYLSVICPFEKITSIITDSSLSEEYRKMAAEKNVSLVIAE